MCVGFHAHQGIAFQVEISPYSCPRRGPQRAIVAVGHTLLRTIFVVLKTGQPYQEPTRPILTEKQRVRKAQRPSRELQNLGFEVILKTKTA